MNSRVDVGQPSRELAPRSITQEVARRYLTIHHLLAPPRSLPSGPTGVLDVFERLGSIQFDPLEVAGRNHDLVLLARVSDYRREMTDRLLYEDRSLFEAHNKGLSLLPTSELPWYRITWDRARRRHNRDAFDEHAALVDELLELIRSAGPTSSIDLAPREAIEWSWRPTNQVRAILEALAEAGVLGLSRRDGNRRVYDLIERLFPPELLKRVIEPREQLRHKLHSRYRAHGLLGRSGPAELWYGTFTQLSNREAAEVDAVIGTAGRHVLLAELVEAGRLMPVSIEGLRGERYIPAESLPLLAVAEREIGRHAASDDRPPGVAFLAALDPLIWDRDFLRALYDFDYVWEVYTPAAKRRWGYYVLPILFGDQLVGRIEPRIERKTNELRVAGLWWEKDFDPLSAPGFVSAFADAIEAHRRFGGVDKVSWPSTTRHRPFVRALRAVLRERRASDC